MPSAASADAVFSRHGAFELLIDYLVQPAGTRILKFRSRRTGLSVSIASVESTIIKGVISVPTEIWDDSGCPHTLEHLNFCGSRNYPWNGVLDKVGNRSLSDGTNAWTAVDSTNFTFSSASQEGFLNILPIYADHVFHPLLTEDAFVTEVYHVDGKGVEGGVVFSEMQGRATDPDDIMQDATRKALYNKNNAYRSETGGLLPNLRKLSIETIRAFHDQAYVPENVSIIAVGPIDPLAVLQTVEREIEPNLVELAHSHWQRPFFDSKTALNPPLIPSRHVEEVMYPDAAADQGRLVMTWIGPNRADFLAQQALSMLGSYLCENTIGPLSKRFIEKAKPDCSGMSFATSSANPTILSLSVSGVPLERLDTLADSIMNVLQDVARLGLDMKHLAGMVKDARRTLLETLEKSAAEYFQSSLLVDALYGAQDGSMLPDNFNDLARLDELSNWPNEKWIKLLKRWVLDNTRMTFLGKPSREQYDKILLDDKKGKAAILSRYGAAGLAKLQKRLDVAKKNNAKPVPRTFLKRIKVPDLSEIHWFSVTSARSLGIAQSAGGHFSNAVQDAIKREKVNLPLFVQFDHIESAFVEVTLLISPPRDAITVALRELLPLYVSSFFCLPIVGQNGEHLPYEELVRRINVELLDYSIETQGEGFAIAVKVPADQYAAAVRWLNDLLYGSIFDVDRLRIVAAQLAQGLEEEAEDGAAVAHSAFVSMLFDQNSNDHTSSLLSRMVTVPDLVRELRKTPQQVVNDLEHLRQILSDVRGMRVSVKGDILKLDKPSGTWLNNFGRLNTTKSRDLLPIVRRIDVLSLIAKKPSRKLDVYRVPANKSTFSHHVTRGPLGDQHPDHAALKVALAVLNSTNGLVWDAIRGDGLAYGASFGYDPMIGTITLHIYRSPDAFKAFCAVREMVDQIESGKLLIDTLDVEAAKSQLAYATAASVCTKDAAADDSFMSQVVFDRPQDWSRQLLARVQLVTLKQVRRVIVKWLPHVFEPSSSIGAVSAGDSTIDQVVHDFQALGFQVTKQELPRLPKSSET